MPGRVRLNHLRAFDAAARHLSFTAAGEELNVSQAAISQQISGLEAALDTLLFQRNNRTLSLTERGRAYAVVVREVLDRLDSATAQIFPRTNPQVVTIRCTPSVASNWLAPRMGAFHQLHQGIEVRLRTLDLGLAGEPHGNDLEIFRGAEGEDDGRTIRLLWRAEILPVCSPGYLARRGPIPSPEALAQCDLIDIIGYANNWHRWMRRFAPGIAARAPMMSVDGLNIAIEVARRDEGIILGRRPLIDAWLESGRLVRALDTLASLESFYYLRSDTGLPARSAARLLADWLHDQGTGVQAPAVALSPGVAHAAAGQD